MYILEVIPLINLPPQVPQILSYFFEHSVLPGFLVGGALGKRKIKGVVLSCTALEEKKISIKKASFQIKKLSGLLSEVPLVSQAQFAIAAWLARRYYAPIGMCLKTVLPPFFGIKKYALRAANGPDISNRPEKKKPLILQIPASEAFSRLRVHLKFALKDDGQVLVIAPDTTVANYFFKVISQEQPKTVYLTSGLSNSDIHKIWLSVAAGDIKIVVATRVGLFLPFRKLALVIIEDSSNYAYKSDMAPRYVTTDVAQYIANVHNAQIAYITACLDIGQFYAIQRKQALVDDLNQPRIETAITVSNTISEVKSGNFSMFSRSLEFSLEHALSRGGSVLFYSSRRGYSGLLVCKNCGLIFRCARCNASFRAYKSPPSASSQTEWMLICYHCSAYHSFPKVCPNCHSNNLSAAGTAGSQKIYDAVQNFIERRRLSGIKIFIFDSDLIRTPVQEQTMLDLIDATPQKIIIGTQMIFSHRYRWHFDLVAIINIDAISDFINYRTDENLMIQLEKLLDFNAKQIIVQTYNTESLVLKSFASRNWLAFYDTELSHRQILGYPPFSRLIKLNYRHKNSSKAEIEARTLGEKLKMVIHQLELSNVVSVLGPSPAFIAKINNIYSYIIILKISPIFEKLDKILKFVPSNWLIDVDPTNF